MLQTNTFDKEEHIFRSPQLADLLKDAIRFFNGTPVYELPPPEKFIGSGIYAVYYIGTNELYSSISNVNRLAYNLPIYVGKAIPTGGRKGQGSKESASLYKRIGEHAKSIQAVASLELADFRCRFILVPHEEDGLIAPIESAIIKAYNPLWNAWVDGFGNHDPGEGRQGQAKSQWDVIHPGRKWADKLRGLKGQNDSETSLKRILDYSKSLNPRDFDAL